VCSTGVPSARWRCEVECFEQAVAVGGHLGEPLPVGGPGTVPVRVDGSAGDVPGGPVVDAAGQRPDGGGHQVVVGDGLADRGTAGPAVGPVGEGGVAAA